MNPARLLWQRRVSGGRCEDPGHFRQQGLVEVDGRTDVAGLPGEPGEVGADAERLGVVGAEDSDQFGQQAR